MLKASIVFKIEKPNLFLDIIEYKPLNNKIKHIILVKWLIWYFNILEIIDITTVLKNTQIECENSLFIIFKKV